MKLTRTYTQGARAESVADTRERITRAAADLFIDSWYEDVTLSSIARAAGVSHQTVLNHFASKEGVALAAAALVGAETETRRDKAAPGDVEGALHVLVSEYERFGDSNARWAFFSERLDSLAAVLDEARAGHRRWLTRTFASSLPADSVTRRRLLNALHAATDVYVWRLLRRDLGLSRAEVERAMAALVRGVLAPPADPKEGDA